MDASPLLVRELMTVGVEVCKPDTSIVILARIFLDKSIEDIVVLEEGNAVGVVGRDEIALAFLHDNPKSLNAEDIMRHDVPIVPPDIPVAAAAQVMRDQGVRSLFLMHHAGGIEYPAAVISYYHLLRKLTAASPEELNDLGIHARRESPIQTFLQRRDEARKGNRSG
jgi:CBS domain-containing protein